VYVDLKLEVDKETTAMQMEEVGNRSGTDA